MQAVNVHALPLRGGFIAGAVKSLIDQMTSAARNSYHAIARANRNRRMDAALRQLNARTLADIGIHRSEIMSVVKK